MRNVLKMLAATLGVVLVATVGAAPASAAGVETATVYTVECSPYFQPGPAPWFTGKDGQIIHRRNATSTNDIFVWTGSGWSYGGTDDVTININGTLTQYGFDGSAWGDFGLHLGTIGSYEGAWSWGKGSTYGPGAGRGVDGFEDRRIRLAWSRQLPEDWPVEPFTACADPSKPNFIYLQLDITKLPRK